MSICQEREVGGTMAQLKVSHNFKAFDDQEILIEDVTLELS